MEKLKKIDHTKIEYKLVFQILWFIMIWLACIGYLSFRFTLLLQGDINIVDKVIGAVFVTITLFPLIKEIDIFGFKIIKDMKVMKEQVKEYQEETSKTILSIKENLYNQTVNTVTTNFTVPYIEGIHCGKVEKKEETPLLVTEEQVFCFKVKTTIERLLNTIAKNYKMEWDGKHFVPLQNIRSLKEFHIIEQTLYEDVKRILILCNRSIHGEILPQEYSEYVKEHYVRIIKELEKVVEQDK